MIIRPKHILLTIIGIILSVFIFWVNFIYFPGNELDHCLNLSVMTFLIWYLCWCFYFELRDFWQLRWYGKNVAHPNVSISPVIFPIGSKKKSSVKAVHNELNSESSNIIISGELIHWSGTKPNSPIIIFSHGFSDNSTYIRHYTIPIALAGYDVISYDSRGTGKSRKMGNKKEFVQITQDLGSIILKMQMMDEFKGRSIILIGKSLGSVSSFNQALKYHDVYVEKIIAIASIGNYLDVLPSSPIPFKKNWWLWFRYKFFNIPINPLPHDNKLLSPLLQLKEKYHTFPNDMDWEAFTNSFIHLIHAENDKIITFDHFQNNKNLCKLKEKNFLITKKGGHNFMKYELSLVSAIITILKY